MHTSVLTNQVLQFLKPSPGKIIIDATLGGGGHAKEITEELKGKGTLYGIDADERNLVIARSSLKEFPNVHFIHDNFENLEEISRKILLKERRIDGILFDLGLSSFHIEEAGRGFSFQSEGPLDMRFDHRQKISAADIINTYPFEQLLFIFKTYGEDKYSYRIAKAISEARRHKHFTTTTQLADFIEAVVTEHGKYSYQKIHPATRIFQSLRIATNREIEVLEKGLAGAIKAVSSDGRIVVISYHSLEDRVVKNIFRDKSKEGVVRILTKKPQKPTEEEIEKNPKSRSAKLRAVEKL